MKPQAQQPPHIPFALEMHSSDPEQLVRFYEEVLKVTFISTSYPSPRYMANLGQFALVITDSRQDTSSEVEPGSVTLTVLSSLPAPSVAQSHFLYPHRPLGGRFPSRYAGRMRDPEGHYLALVQALTFSQMRMPPVSSWRGLGSCIADFALLSLTRLTMKARVCWDHVLDYYEYTTNSVTITDRGFDGYTHLVASRQGIFAVCATSYKQLVRGRFFGLTLKDGDIYCFQTCLDDPTRQDTHKGRLVRLRTKDNRILDAEVLVRGLDDGCHQIDFIGENLLVVDCCNGSILKLAPNSRSCETYYPLGPISRQTAMDDYHMNSVAGHPDGSVWVLLHNYNKRPSEIAVLNANFELVRRFEIKAGSAHNIVFTNDHLEFLVADSYGGRILSGRGPVVEGLTMMPRGLSLDETTCVFGESYFETRLFRKYVPGRIHFADRSSWKVGASLELPAAPTDIRRIDGKDYSLSNYYCALVSRRKTQQGTDYLPIVGWDPGQSHPSRTPAAL
jgi:hypothetical protein